MVRRLRYISIVFALLILIGGGAVYGLYLIIKKNIQNANRVESIVEINVQEHDRLVDLEKILSIMSTDVESLESRIIGKDNTVAFIEYIETLAKSADVAIAINSVLVSPIDNPTFKDLAETLSLTLEIEGDWNNVYAFMQMIETIPYKIVIRSSDFTYNIFERGPQVVDGVETATSRTTMWKGKVVINVLKKK
jgi:hypothetical protein